MFIARQPFHKAIVQLKDLGLIEDFQVGRHETEEDGLIVERAAVKVKCKPEHARDSIKTLNEHYLESPKEELNVHYFIIPTREDAHKLTTHELTHGQLPTSKKARLLELAQRIKQFNGV